MHVFYFLFFKSELKRILLQKKPGLLFLLVFLNLFFMILGKLPILPPPPGRKIVSVFADSILFRTNCFASLKGKFMVALYNSYSLGFLSGMNEMHHSLLVQIFGFL